VKGSWPRLALAILLLGVPAQAQTPAPAAETTPEAPALPVRPYETTITPTGDDALDTALRNVSRLVGLQTRAPTDLAGIIARAAGEPDRMRAALDSEGYFAGTVRVSIAGADPLAPDLARRLPAEGPIPVTVTATPNQRYIIRTARAVALGEPEALREAADHLAGLVGEPARAAAVVEAQGRVVSRLLRAGHPLAEVKERDVVVNHDARAMDFTLNVSPGPFAVFAAPTVAGTVRVRPDFVRRYAAIRLEGRPFDPDRAARTRADLVALGVFDGVRLATARSLDERGRLPVSITVTERKRQAIGASAAYETALGGTIRTYYEHRNLFGAAERLRIEAELTRLGAADVSRSGYRFGATFRDPFAFNRDWAFVGSLFALRERLKTYDRDGIVGSFLFERRLNDRLTFSTGPAFEIGRSGPAQGRLEPAEVVGWQFGLRWDSTDNLLDPRRGFRAQATVTPSYSIEQGNLFVSTRAQGSTYWDVSGNGRSILAVRASVGQLFGTEARDVPITQRFFAGGGASVRGYDFQSIGPRQPGSKRSSGGSSLLDGSLEWRQRFGGNWGAAAFVDAGRVSGGGSGTVADKAAWRLGVGVGARYYTVIGPVRVDVALPLVRQPGSQGYGLYIGIGQAF
jgi:translocation and assembly module TamA